MKVILLEDVKALGKKGQVVNVSDGYARNLLLPKKLGVEATGKNMNDLKLQKAHEDKVAQENLDAAKAFAEELKDKQVTVGIKVGEGGRTLSETWETVKESGGSSGRKRTKQFQRFSGGDKFKPECGFFTSDQPDVCLYPDPSSFAAGGT